MAISVQAPPLLFGSSLASPPAQPAQVPVGTRAALLFWAFWSGNAGHQLVSAGLGGAPFAVASSLPVSGDVAATGVAFLENPPEGTQALAVQIGQPAGEGAVYALALLAADGTLSLRTAAVSGSAGNGGAVVVGGPSLLGDFVVGFGQGFGSVNASPAGTEQTTLATVSANQEVGKLFTMPPGASSTQALVTGNYVTAALAVVQEEAIPMDPIVYKNVTIPFIEGQQAPTWALVYNGISILIQITDPNTNNYAVTLSRGKGLVGVVEGLDVNQAITDALESLANQLGDAFTQANSLLLLPA